MSTFPLLFGEALRATRINSCGLPIAGAQNRICIEGFVSVNLGREMKQANDIEQINAQGLVCVSDRTPPVRKWYNVDLEICSMATGLVSMFTGWPAVLDYAGNPVGVRDKSTVDPNYGVAFEVWTGGRASTDCPAVTNDDGVFTSGGTGKSYGYLLFGVIEIAVTSDIKISADLQTITLSGITTPMTQWGRGPYNVVDVGANQAGRLLTPFPSDPHIHIERTPVPPPAYTESGEPTSLEIASIFTPPNYYFGGPAGQAACSVAPAQNIGSWE